MTLVYSLLGDINRYIHGDIAFKVVFQANVARIACHDFEEKRSRHLLSGTDNIYCPGRTTFTVRDEGTLNR